jgi:hypothetical protein
MLCIPHQRRDALMGAVLRHNELKVLPLWHSLRQGIESLFQVAGSAARHHEHRYLGQVWCSDFRVSGLRSTIPIRVAIQNISGDPGHVYLLASLSGMHRFRCAPRPCTDSIVRYNMIISSRIRKRGWRSSTVIVRPMLALGARRRFLCALSLVLWRWF